MWYNDIGTKVELNHGGRGILKGKGTFVSFVKVTVYIRHSQW